MDEISVGRANEHAPADDQARAHDLLMLGSDHVLRGSDTGVLVAFAAIAFAEIRGDKKPHCNLGLAVLLISVLMCAVVHFAVGNAYIGRAKRLLAGGDEKSGRWQGTFTFIAFLSGVLQLVCIVLGLYLVLVPDLPAWLEPRSRP